MVSLFYSNVYLFLDHICLRIKLKFLASWFFLNPKNILMCFLVNSGSHFSELTGDMCVLSHFSCVPLFENLWTVAHQVPLCPWYSPGKNTGVGCHAFLQGIFRIHGMNLCLLCLLHWQENCHLRSFTEDSQGLLSLPCSSSGKESACNAGNSGSIPGSGSFPGEGIGYLL